MRSILLIASAILAFAATMTVETTDANAVVCARGVHRAGCAGPRGGGWWMAWPGYASVLAMYAFALEENGEYHRAEKIARRALALDPRHAGAIHVVVHVMEMQGRARGCGIPCCKGILMGRRQRIFRASRMASRAAPARRGGSQLCPRDVRCADREWARIGYG